MKKYFLSLCALCVCANIMIARDYPTRLAMVGDAVSTGWNIGDTYMETTEDGVYTWVGTLNDGALKFLAGYDWVPSYGPSANETPLATGKLTLRADYDGADNAFSVTAGVYKIDINLATLDITLSDGQDWPATVQPTYPGILYPVGDAFEWGWSLDGFSMSETAFNSGKYEDTVTLKPGEMKFMHKHDFGASLYGPENNGDGITTEGTFTMTSGTDDKKWQNSLEGKYVITLDATTMQLTIRDAAPTAIESVTAEAAARKVIRNGQIVIICADKAYNVLGIQL